VVIVGGGPAGLAAAIEARRAGFDALVLELRGRERNRPNTPAVNLTTLNYLARLGLDMADGHIVSYVRRYDAITPHGKRSYSVPPPRLNPASSNASVVDLLWNFAWPRATLPINELERGLIHVGESQQVGIQFNTAVTGISSHPDGVIVRAVQGGKQVDFTGDLAIVATGAGGELRDTFGVAFDPVGPTTTMLSTVLDHPGDGVLLNVQLAGANGFTSWTRLDAKQGTGILAELSPGTQLGSNAEREQLARSTAHFLGAPAAPFLTPPTVFELSNRQTTRDGKPTVLFAPRVLGIGDAVRVVPTFLGLGLQSALKDSVRLGQLFARLAKQPGFTSAGSQRAIARFDRETTRASARLLTRGVDRMKQHLATGGRAKVTPAAASGGADRSLVPASP
jgi:2-polyprenyl-6-methoxyphenol hydroxylase-like FAD-dependent oxidoreductase